MDIKLKEFEKCGVIDIEFIKLGNFISFGISLDVCPQSR